MQSRDTAQDKRRRLGNGQCRAEAEGRGAGVSPRENTQSEEVRGQRTESWETPTCKGQREKSAQETEEQSATESREVQHFKEKGVRKRSALEQVRSRRCPCGRRAGASKSKLGQWVLSY